ncbi:MAG: hypothetical protein JF619_06335 [Massilia sp.]|nr:hypothetical protein [Massilia sp.]
MRTLHASALLLVLFGAAVAHAGPVPTPFAPADAVSPAVLDACRGGFTTPTGLTVTLGIERIVTVDGHVAARSELQLGDLGRLAAGASPPPALSAVQATLGPDGGGLTVRLGAAAGGATVIQNSLDGQAIANTTIIHATVGTQGMLQAMHFQATLANALNAAVTGR